MGSGVSRRDFFKTVGTAAGAAGLPRPHWKRLVDLLGSWQPAELADRWEQARRLIRDNGVTYNVHDDTAGEQRPWVLDPIPLVISQADWERLEVGINQRARVLDALLADLYGPQHTLREGVVPPELVYANPAFLRCCHGIIQPGGRWLHLHAVVVARNRDGKWMALGDRTGVPQGLGYALENRLAISRLLPDVFQECHVERLAPFFIALRSHLRALMPGRDSPRVALQSPGPASATYFEDAYLARYLGFPLVEGGDLTVRDDRLALKTLGGLVPLVVEGPLLASANALIGIARQGSVLIGPALAVIAALLAAILANAFLFWRIERAAGALLLPYAQFMHQVGTLKNKPAAWQDLFFPELHDQPGS